MKGQTQRRWETNASHHRVCAQNHSRYEGPRLKEQKCREKDCCPDRAARITATKLRDACRGAVRVTDPDTPQASILLRELHQRPCPVTPDPSRFSLLHVFTKRKPELTGHGLGAAVFC